MAVRTVGVEEEFLLIHSDGTLADVGERIVHRAEQRDADGQFEHELKQAQAEIGSRPATDLADLAEDVTRLRQDVVAAAAELRVSVAASATHPLAVRPRGTVDARYERMNATFGAIAANQLTCGMHVHVSVQSPDEGVAVIDRVQPWLALLTALSSNSPFQHGEDTGYASYRSVLWRNWPTAGPTEIFGSLDSYRQQRDDLIASGAALDEGMLYYDIRLSRSYPTVEIRVADVSRDVATSTLIAALARALVETAARGSRSEDAVSLYRTNERVELLRARAWRAARWGMSRDLLTNPAAPRPAESHPFQTVPANAWECAGALVAHVEPVLSEYGDLDRVHGELERLRRVGTGAERQRAAYARGGFDAVFAQLTLDTAE